MDIRILVNIRLYCRSHNIEQTCKPVLQLQRKMRRVQSGDFQERAVVHSNDEIGLLTEGFNSMVSSLDIMIKEMYELRLREKDSELNALQSQINPHFLYVGID